LIECALPRNRCLSRSLSAATCFFKISAMLRSELTHLCGTLALAKFVAGAFLELRQIGGLLARISLPLSAQLSFRQLNAFTPTTSRTRHFSTLAFGHPTAALCFARGSPPTPTFSACECPK